MSTVDVSRIVHAAEVTAITVGVSLTFADLLALPEGSLIEDCVGNEWLSISDGWLCSAAGALGPSDPDSVCRTWSPFVAEAARPTAPCSF